MPLHAPATAVAKQELTVSPLIMELEAEAGEELVEEITATASGDEAIVVQLVHADFGFGDDYGVVLINDDAPETTAFSTRGWFSLPQDRYRIPAGQSRVLPLSIKVPRNTPGGTYLGAALLRIVPPDAEGGGNQVQAVPQSGPLLFIAVAGGDPPKPVVERFELPGLQRSGPIKPALVVGNDGDEFFTLEGTVKLTGPGKDEVIEVRRQFVVPGEPREILAAAEDGESDEGPLRLGSSKLGFGRYEVTSRLRVEPTGTTLVSTKTVWVVPTWVWFAGVLALAALATLVALTVRRLAAIRDIVTERPPTEETVEHEDSIEEHEDSVDEFDEDDSEDDLDELEDDLDEASDQPY